MKRSKASVLIGLLWCTALVAILVISVLHSSRMGLMIGKNYGDRLQAHYLALAGIEKAKALLYQDVRDRSRTARNHTGDLYDSAQNFRDVPLGRGRFRVLRRAQPAEGGDVIFGVSDEESRLNVNVASLEELSNLQGMTPDVASAIADWHSGSQENMNPGGAKDDYYLSLQPPCLPRDGPFQTVRELLMVRGINRDLLLANDLHQNGMLDSDQDAGGNSVLDSGDLGWANLLTVDSSTSDLNAAGEDRVNIQTADQQTLASVRGLDQQIASAIVTYRNQNQNRFQSVADLLDVTAPQNQSLGNPLQNAPAAQGDQGQPSSGPGNSGQNNQGNNPGGPKVVSQGLLMDIADGLTAQSKQDVPGLVNINTASLDVLICLPGLTRQLAQDIIRYRESSGYFPNIAHLLKVPGMTEDIFKAVAPRLTVRSETFRILAEGLVPSSGARQRVQEIVHVGLHSVRTVSYREDDL